MLDCDLRERLLGLAKQDAVVREERERKGKRKKEEDWRVVRVHEAPFDWNAVDRDYTARGIPGPLPRDA